MTAIFVPFYVTGHLAPRALLLSRRVPLVWIVSVILVIEVLFSAGLFLRIGSVAVALSLIGILGTSVLGRRGDVVKEERHVVA